MKKIVFPKFSVICAIISSVLFSVYLLIKILIKFDTYIYLFGVSTQELMPFITFPCVALLFASIYVLLCKNIRRKALISSIIILLSILVFSYMLLDNSFSPDSEYFEFRSDDQEHDIVINECSFLLGGWGYVYEKTSFCTMKRLGRYSTDDGFCPIAKDAYYFVWNEDDFEFHYSFFGNKNEEYRVVIMEYVK